MNACLLNVFHHRRHEDVVTVAHRIDVNLDGVLQEFVDQHGMLLGYLHSLLDVAIKLSLIVDDLHRSSAKHVRWPYEQGITDVAGNALRLLP